ncbi:MAG: FAD-dependent oxidoreductase [Actinophytocola sp.]|nr:FAD-dependent oxidoreductase [Actinophytocola sp.]
MSRSSRLGPEYRADAWRRLDDGRFDVLVIGGGVTGAGTALDAVTRGLSTALVEARDFACGTSSRSSKLFHGGLRYLEQLNFGLVREALTERDLMLTTIAPHLVKPVSFLYPLRRRIVERPYVGAGLVLYDTMGGSHALPRHRHLTRTGARALCPALRPDTLVGAVRYWDATTDDARHTLTTIRTAAHHGAVVRNSTEVAELIREGGRVIGARLRDAETGRTATVYARVVINCTGVWTDDIQALTDSRGRFRVRASKGVHILVSRDRIASETGLILRTEKSVLFVIPWDDHWLIGTTDTDWNLDKAHPAASQGDIDYLLDRVNAVLAAPLSHDDVVGVYAGLRPLLAGESEDTSQLSREHAVARPQPGLISVAGGKYTTYRVMAADAVDAAAADLDERVPPSVTERVPLLGADGYHAAVNQAERIAAEHRLPAWRARLLLDRYGTLIDEVLAPGADDPTLLDSLPGADRYLKAEIRYGATHEAATHLGDVLTRRTRVCLDVAHRGTDSAKAAAELLAEPLGWDAERIDTEVRLYHARVAAERDAEQQTDDRTADTARLAARDTRAVRA